MVVAHDTGLPVDPDRRDEHRLAADGPQAVDQGHGLLMAHALGVIAGAREIASLGVVGVDEIGHGDHLAHALDGGRRHTVVELSLVAHDGVHIDGGTVGGLLTAILRHDARLPLRSDEARGDGVVAEAESLPHGKDTRDVVGGVEEVELAIVERVGHDGCRQVVGGVAHIGKDGQHGRRGHLAVSANIVDQKNLLRCHDWLFSYGETTLTGTMKAAFKWPGAAYLMHFLCKVSKKNLGGMKGLVKISKTYPNKY